MQIIFGALGGLTEWGAERAKKVTKADLCEKLHEDAEHLFRTLALRLDRLQEGD